MTKKDEQLFLRAFTKLFSMIMELRYKVYGHGFQSDSEQEAEEILKELVGKCDKR